MYVGDYYNIYIYIYIYIYMYINIIHEKLAMTSETTKKARIMISGCLQFPDTNQY